MSWRGRGGRRGRRGWGYNSRSEDSQSVGSGEAVEVRDSSSQRPRPPPGLCGRDIGLWYRDQNARRNVEIKNKVDEKIRDSFSCALTEERQEHLTELIDTLWKSEYQSHAKSSASFLRKYQNNLQENDNADLTTKVAIKNEFGDTSEEKFDSKIFTASRDPEFDNILIKELHDKKESKGYQEMLKFRSSLPANKLQQDIVNVIQENQVVIISGETGCGKTTQVPQFILDSEILASRGSECNIVCTQPRRISAISVAERVASERNEMIGDSVGYSIRLEHRFARKASGKITFMTTGVMFQCLQSSPTLSNVSHLIIDEVHERSIHSDLLLVILKDILPRRPTLKVILMSATMNAAQFSEYFGVAPIINIPGFTFPITEYYLEDAIEHTNFVFEQQIKHFGFRRRPKFVPPANGVPAFENVITESYIQELRDSSDYSESTLEQLGNSSSEEVNADFIQSLIEHISSNDKTFGAILVFVTGWDLISKLCENLESCGRFPKSKFRIYPLHSMMPTVNQKEIFQKPPPGARKIVIATQIAETSITIDDILWVIDCGKIKLGNFDESLNLSTLDTEWVALANAQQRRGRAGRTKPGFVYHLFSRRRKDTLEKFKKPEILRSRLEETILQIKILKLGKTARLLKRLLDPPSDRATDLGLETLVQLHALDNDEQLTPLGFHLAHLPMDPQTGKMILMGAIFSCVDPIFSIAASLSFKDPFYRPLGKEEEVDAIRRSYSKRTKSDHIILSEVIRKYEEAEQNGSTRQFCYKNFLSENTVKMLVNMKSQLAGYLCKLGFLKDANYKREDLNLNSRNLGIVTAVTAAGLYPNVVSVEYLGRAGRCAFRSAGMKVYIHPGSVNCGESRFDSPYLMYFKKIRSSMIFLHDTTMVNPFALIFFGGMLDWMEDFGSNTVGKVSVDGKFELTYPKKQNFRFFVESLRTELDKFLEFKVNNPGPMDWEDNSKEGCLLNAIIELLTCEYESFKASVDEDEDDSRRQPRRRASYQQKRRYGQRDRD